MSVATKQVRLSYEDLYQLKWLLGGCLSLISLWTLLYLEVRSGPLITLTAAVISAGILWPSLPSKIPAVFMKAAVPSLLVVIAADFFLSRPDIIPPLIRMVILLVLARSLAYRKRREDLQLILLCLFIVVISGVLTLSLTFAFQIIIFTPCAMALLFVINLLECHDREHEIPQEGLSEFKLVHFFIRIIKIVDLRMVAFASLLFIGVLLVSTFIFVVIPRFRLDQAIPFLNLKSQKSRSGFSDTIHFGDVVEIIEDNSVALRVDLPPGVEIPQTPYWRMVVLDDYSNESFRISSTARLKNIYDVNNVIKLKKDFPALDEVGDEAKWTFYLEGGISRFLPVLGLFDTMRFQTRQNIEINRLLRINSTKDISSGVLFYQVENMQMMDKIPATWYERKLANLKPLIVDRSSRQGERTGLYPQTTLVLPGGSGNIETLERIVSEITEGNKLSVQEFTTRALDYLRTNHNYDLGYDVTSREEEGDVLIRWLNSKSPGHCELFAGSFTLLARMAGHPARIVTGFKGGAWNGYENYYMVRNRNAHAWCEIYDGEGSWVLVDPTSGTQGYNTSGGLTAVSASTFYIDDTWRAYVDSLRILWYRRIVNFDKTTQKELTSQIKLMGSAFIDGLQFEIKQWLHNIVTWFNQPINYEKAMRIIILFIISLSIFLLIRYRSYILSQLSTEAKILGFDLGADPVRKKAGKLVVKFRNKQSELAITRGSMPQEWHDIYRDLLTLRFNDGHDRPSPRGVFRKASRLLKQKNRMI